MRISSYTHYGVIDDKLQPDPSACRHENFHLDPSADRDENFQLDTSPMIDDNFELDPTADRHGSYYRHCRGSMRIPLRFDDTLCS